LTSVAQGHKGMMTMPKGGARSRSGPAPDPNSARSERRADGWTVIPSTGRGEPAPEWPLTEATSRELVIWERWWRKPEAVLWDADGSIDYVALTVRMFAEAEVEKASAENRKTVRMMMADLFLTRDAKNRAQIRIASDELAEKRTETPEQPKRERRLRVAGDDAQ
jgi:hypothetical protein